MSAARKRVAIYARVSTDKQTTQNQLKELRAVAKRHGWEIAGEFIDNGVSGAKGRSERAAFDRMLTAAARREFDLIAAWSVDRLGRSLQHLVSFLAEIHGKRIDLFLYQQGIDTTTPAGKALFQMCGVFAEFERAMIVERVQAGLQRAKVQGTKSGRPIGRPRVTKQVERKVLDARASGKGYLKIAREIGVGVGTVRRIVMTPA